jgi:transketolase
MSSTAIDLDLLSVNTIRTLAMDAVQAANSGHPGTPMALAPAAYALWNDVLRYDPSAPRWPNRDRFVLSCGHASMLLYALLHLAQVRDINADGTAGEGLAVSLEELRRFRQLHSRTPGHPENFLTPGVETTTGPLGQGAGNSVGMALAGRWLASHFNRPSCTLFDYHVFAFCSDGDLMEGVCNEAASLAGHLGLGNLCWLYDDNRITIEGETSLAFSEDVGRRFEGLGWRVRRLEDANDLPALRRALAAARRTRDKPTLLVLRSHIAWGSPNKQDTHEAHGAPLGADEVRLTKRAYGWPEDEQFHVPPEVLDRFREGVGARGLKLRRAWERRLKQYGKQHPELAEQLRRLERGDLPEGWDADIPTFPPDAKGLATRVSSGKVLNAVARRVPWLVGGAADLAPSTMTLLTYDGAGRFSGDSVGQNMHFGIREHGMAAALNGMALCKLRPYGATFFIFSDYLRPAMRLSALMGLPALYVFTHDSIGLGEDGPTHQPIEHLAAVRAIPGLILIRPADANEVAEAYRTVLTRKDRPVALVLSRQNLPTLDRSQHAPAAGLARGAYVLSDAAGGRPQVILMASGSEVPLCLAAQGQLAAAGVAARVVSFPSWELFEEQEPAYRDRVLPPDCPARVAVEAGIAQGWERYLGPRGRFVGLSGFGASAPSGELMKHFGLTSNNVVAAANEVMAGAGP